MLEAYWDESGSSTDPFCAFVGMAGLVARKQDWQRFQALWAAALQAHKLPYFHAAKMEHGRKPFRPKKDWPFSRKESLQDEPLPGVSESVDTVAVVAGFGGGHTVGRPPVPPRRCRPPSSMHSPFRDGRPLSLRCGAATTRGGRARGPAAVWIRSRRCSCDCMKMKVIVVEHSFTASLAGGCDDGRWARSP